jgi:hypothetical protein
MNNEEFKIVPQLIHKAVHRESTVLSFSITKLEKNTGKYTTKNQICEELGYQ